MPSSTIRVEAEKKELPKLGTLFTIGADIEWGYVGENGFVSADTAHGGPSTSGIFGTDGASHIAEIRPDPAYSPYQLMKNTYTALKQGWDTHTSIRKLKWIAGSLVNENPIGTHLHCNLRPDPILTEMFDKVLVPFGVLFENERDAAIRRGGSYGGYATTRDTSHSGFEYRPLSSILYSQGLTLSIYAIFHALIYSFHEGAKPPTNVEKNDRALKTCDKEYFYEQMPKIWNYLLGLPAFREGAIDRQYIRTINQFYTMIKAKKTIDPQSRDMRFVWKLDSYTELVKTDNRKLHISEVLGMDSTPTVALRART